MKRTYLTLIVAMLVIGFAAVTTNLVINGTLKIGSNTDEFEKGVVFTRTNTMHGDATISENGKSITFKTTVLKDLKEESVLEYDITNKSLEYDAEISMNCEIQESDKQYEEYIDLENSIKEEKFTLASGNTKTGKITITLKKTYVGENKSITFKCEINANAVERTSKGEYIPKEVEYEEILLNGATPVLEASSVEAVSLETEESNKKLIPVTIDEEDGTVRRADTTKEWYDYETKKWANAVILVDGVEDPGINQPILENQIESYFVWIPKYRYKIFDMGHYTSIEPEDTSYKEKSLPIEIEFGTENTENNTYECETPGISGEDGSCAVGKWMTHPAFTTFGDIKGFWVGKFETGYNQNVERTNVSLNSNWTKEGAEKDEEDSSKVIIKPNVFSWRKIDASNMYNVSYNYERQLDSHMMKNTEWGAVAYLSHSKYGTCTENKCIEIMINNSINYVTGFSSKERATSGYNGDDSIATNKFANTTPKVDSDYSYNYTNKISTIASTTSNYTGIYDMSGGADERVMGIEKRHVLNSNTGFTEQTQPEDKYIDIYNVDDNSILNAHIFNYNFRILGDATGEMGPFAKSSFTIDNREISYWYKDQAWFNNGIFTRGNNAYHGLDAGVFAFGPNLGHNNYEYITFRIVLSPQ